AERRQVRLLCTALCQQGVARSLRVHGESRRALVADHRRNVCGARDQAGDWNAPCDAGLAAGAGAAAGSGGDSAALAQDSENNEQRSFLMESEEIVDVFTDGACKYNPGPGGWGAILRFRGEEKELWGGEAGTTNNRMELTAVIRALEAL